MECYYSCQGKYMCQIESFLDISSISYVIVIFVQDANGTNVIDPVTKTYPYTEGNILSQDKSNIHTVPASSLPTNMSYPLTVIVQDLTQYQNGTIPYYLAVDFSYYYGTTESGANYRSKTNPTTVMQFNNAGLNSVGQRQYSYQFTPIGKIQHMFFDFNPLNRIKYVPIGA